jgi:hypothetical protein
MRKNRLAAYGLAAGLLGGGVAGIAFGADGSAPASNRSQHLADTLAPLVSNGTITQAQADAVIAALEAAKPAHDHRGGPGGGPGRGPGNLEAAAGALGVTTDELRTALQGGQSLAEVAQSKGIDVEQVVNALVAELKAHLDEEVAAGEHTQAEADQELAGATERIRAFVNGEAPAPGGHGHGRPGPDASPAPQSTTSS